MEDQDRSKEELIQELKRLRNEVETMRNRSSISDISRRRLQALVNALPDIAFILDENGKYVEVMASEDSLLSSKAMKLVGTSIFDRLPKATADSFLETIRLTIETGEPQTLEYRLEVRAGDKWFEARTAPVTEEEDGRKLVIWVSRDISTRKSAEQRLQFQAQLLDGVRESIIAFDLKGNVIFWGKGATRLYGYSSDDMMGKPVRDMLGPVGRREFDRITDEVIQKGFWEGEYIQKRKDGSRFWVDSRISLAISQHGDVLGLIGIEHDVTSRKLAEEALNRTAEDWISLFDAIPDPITIIDQDFRIIRANRAALDHFGSQDLIGSLCHELLHFPDENKQACPAAKTFETGEPMEVIVRDQQIEGKIFTISTYPILNADGEATKVVHIAKEKTE